MLLWVVVFSGMICATLLFLGLMLSNGSRLPLVSGESGDSWIPWPTLSVGQKVILVMGVDAPHHNRSGEPVVDPFEGTRTDTMMLVRVDSNQKKASVVSIPRDSKVYLAKNRGIDKINAAHAIGGPELSVQTVQDSFGIPVDHFIVVNFAGVRELVDALGGVNIAVDRPMRYTDRTANLTIDLQPGPQHMNGQQAEGFLRFRHDALGDIGRIRRQQQFLVSVARRLREPGMMFKIPKLVELANKHIVTDMSGDQLLGLASFGKDLKMEQIRSATLPGRPGGVTISYWIVDPRPAQLVLDRLILDNNTPMPGMLYQINPEEPVKVGIFYDPSMEDSLPALTEKLAAAQFNVICKAPTRRATSSQIIEHTVRTTDSLTQNLRALEPRLKSARLIFAPVGTTFENNACSSTEDYTVILGSDRAAH